MKKNSLLVLSCLTLGLVAFAQDPGKKPEPAPAPKPGAQKPADPKPADKAKTPERPKDDAVTAKDAAIVAIDGFIKTKVPAERPNNWKLSLSQPPKLTFAKDAQYEWHMKTNKGPITIRLMPDVAPMHVSSTIYLARLGFYDGLTFHRVIKGFMAQGGDPLANGGGGPGYKYAGEFDPKARHDKPGRVSMANAGPNTDGSQFFLTFAPQPSLDDKHTIFGEVISGMETLKALEAAGSEGEGPTKEPLVMEQTWIVVKPAPAPPEKPAAPAKPAPPEKKGGE